MISLILSVAQECYKFASKFPGSGHLTLVTLSSLCSVNFRVNHEVASYSQCCRYGHCPNQYHLSGTDESSFRASQLY